MGMKCTLDLKIGSTILSDMDRLDGTTIDYGYPEDVPHENSDMNLATLALIQDQGMKVSGTNTWKIPPRPFLSFYAPLEVEEQMSRYNRMIGHTIGEGKASQNMVMNFIGNECADAVRKAIDDGTYVKLSNMTIQLKGHDTILIDSGQLYDDATFSIER